MPSFGGQKISFDQLCRANVARYKDYPCDDWTPTDWGCCLAGEVGETCNLLKKLKLGKDVEVSEIGKEIADVIIYADILAEKLGFDLGQLVREKFNEVSKRVGSKVEL
jgi:NTP pyrophosphatase (non-canonical NTP hydrolase)